MVFFALILLCVILLGYFYKTKSSNYWKKRNIVEVDRNAWHFIVGNYSLSEFYKIIYDSFESEDCIGTYMGLKPVLILKNLEDIKAVLQNDFQSFHSRGYKMNPKDDLAQNLLLIDDYKKWKLIRKILSPTFTSMKLKKMYTTLERSASDFVKYFEINPLGRKNPYEALHKFTSASISASVLGINSNTENVMESPLVEIFWKAADSLTLFNLKFSLAIIFPTIFNYFNLKVFGSQKDLVVDTIQNLLRKRQHINEKSYNFIDTCLELDNERIIEDNQTRFNLKVTPEFLGAQAYSFFFAGVDTAANSMNFTLLELSNNCEILKKLHSEIDCLFDNCDGSISYDDITKMHYMDMVISESLRKYPPVGLMQRICNKETFLPGASIKIDKDCIVIVPIYGIHRDSKYFPNPNNFDPERFSAENRAKIINFSYLPFGEGNRICLGSRFANIQMKCGLVWLLRHYTLKGYNYTQECFEPSLVGIRDSKARYDLISRN